jgi:hypothetical protein
LRVKGNDNYGDALTLFNRKVRPFTCFGVANGITFEQLFATIKSSTYNDRNNMKPAMSATSAKAM